jgi:hypothetical protein
MREVVAAVQVGPRAEEPLDRVKLVDQIVDALRKARDPTSTFS